MDSINFSVLSNFSPQQKAASIECSRKRYFLFGGRRGVKKSYWLRWYLLLRLLKWHAQGFSNVRVGLFCEDFPTLTDRQVSKIQTEFPNWLGEVRTTKIDGFGFHLHKEYGGGVIAFRSLDDPLKYKGSEFAGIGIEELTHNPEFVEPELRFLDVMDGSLRWPHIDDSFLACTSNPDGPGQLWVREFFIEKKLSEARKHQADLISYLPGKIEEGDEKLLPQSYWDAINSVGSNLRRAWVEGDWYVSFGGYTFNRAWFKVIDAEPVDFVRVVRYWDKAGTTDDGCNTAGVLMGVTAERKFYVIHCVIGKWSANEREHTILQVAKADQQKYGDLYSVGQEQEPGSGGKQSAEFTVQNLAGFKVVTEKVSQSKDSRERGLEPFAAQTEAGNTFIVAGAWNTDYIDELCQVPHGALRDQADATGGAFNMLNFSGVGISI